MLSSINDRTVDLVVFLCANLFNLLITGIMLSRPFGLARLEYILGIIDLLLIIPLSVAVVLNFLAGRDWWTYVLPVVLIAFLIVELLLDYVLQIPFRETRLLWPYLALFYISAWMMIGYTFLVGKPYGFITLITYFISLGATAYSYSQVGHG
jgi:hypothetical protein